MNTSFFFKDSELKLLDSSSYIWRYLNFHKFQSIIERESLFFSKANKQEDIQEGAYPIDMEEKIKRRWGIMPSDDGNSYSFSDWHINKEIPSHLINCWSLRPTESQKQWSTYTNCSESVAIRSTIKQLRNCFPYKEPIVWIDIVRYGIDRNFLANPLDENRINPYHSPFFFKQKRFSWENEVRALINLSNKNQELYEHTPDGCFIPIDVKTLIESIWIHPKATNDFNQIVITEIQNSLISGISIDQSLWDEIDG